MSPTPTFGQALSDYVIRTANRKRQLTMERVQAVLEDGRLMVRGVSIPSTGRVPIQAGEVVPVAWKDSRPQVVMRNEGNRTGGAPLLSPETHAGVVEELFTIANPTSGKTEVWFRDWDQFSLILPSVLVDSSVRWGGGSADYFAIISPGNVVDVYKLNRPRANEPFPHGRTPKATLVQSYDLSADATVFGSVTLVMQPGGATSTGDLTFNTNLSVSSGALVASFLGRPVFLGVGPNGDLIAQLKTTATVFNGALLVASGGNGSLMINVTTHTVLAVHTASTFINIYNFDCTIAAGGTGSLTTTMTPSGTAADGSSSVTDGGLTLLSSKIDPVTGRSIFNNYVVFGPVGFDLGACEPKPTSTLRVAGQFAQSVASFPPTGISQSVPIFQGSRTRLLYVAGDISGAMQLPIRMLDFALVVGSDVGGDAADAANIERKVGPNARVACLGSDQVYSPKDGAAPFNNQFFVGGIDRKLGLSAVNLKALTHLQRLKDQAPLNKLKTAQHSFLVDNLVSADIQLVNSRIFLGASAVTDPAL